MSLESLFQHIILAEHQAEESRRMMREVRSEITRCRERIKKLTEELNEEKIKLEFKVQQCSEKSSRLQLLKAHENALERQYSEITNQRNIFLQTFETTKKKMIEEEEKFIKEITDFNNEYEITKKRELLMKQSVKIEVFDLENQANILKREIKSMEHDNGQLSELQKQKSELMQELLTLQSKLKVLKDEEKEAICTTKYLEAERKKVNEKPQNDAECLRLKKELELYKEDDMENVYETLQTEIEFLEMIEKGCYIREECFEEGLPWTGLCQESWRICPDLQKRRTLTFCFILYIVPGPIRHRDPAVFFKNIPNRALDASFFATVHTNAAHFLIESGKLFLLSQRRFPNNASFCWQTLVEMLLLWTLTLLMGAVAGSEICYDRFGCFTDDTPWAGILERPLKILPWSPSSIDTGFLLYTDDNPTSYQKITADPSSIRSSNFRTDRKTRFIIHGFIDKGEENWLSNMCKTMLQVESVNCICVDWKGGSRTLYTQASQNVRVVGAEVAYFVDFLKSEFGYSPSNVHVIGHSLGSHAAGEAGRRTNGTIGRITGLDPAEPCFQGTPELVRLDPSDAQFVDIIHTDGTPIIPNLGFGMSQTVGHLDFFPNGGLEMPGCQKNILSQIVDIDGIWEGTRDFAACNHLRSYKYYTDSILNPSGFTGFSCSSYDSFSSNQCFPCANGECPQMGHYADRFSGKTKGMFQKFYLNTGDKSNFSRWRYQVAVTLSGEKVTGHILVSLYGNLGNSKQYEIYKGSLKPGNSHINQIDSDVDVGDLEKIKFIWYNNVINLTRPRVGASRITVTRNDGRVFNFCSQNTVREDVLLTLYSC